MIEGDKLTHEDWHTRFDDRLNRIEADVLNIKLRDAASDVHHKNVEVRLSAIENTLTWLVRLIIGGILAAAIAFVVNGNLSL